MSEEVSLKFLQSDGEKKNLNEKGVMRNIF